MRALKVFTCIAFKAEYLLVAAVCKNSQQRLERVADTVLLVEGHRCVDTTRRVLARVYDSRTTGQEEASSD